MTRDPAAGEKDAGEGGRLTESAFVIGLCVSQEGDDALGVLSEQLRSVPGAALVVAGSGVSGSGLPASRVPVVPVEATVPLRSGRVYLVPAGAAVRYRAGALRPVAASRDELPVDGLLASLAEGFGPRSCGIVLAGAGTDGCRGLERIKGAGGMVLVQEGPAPSLLAELADARMATEEMPERLRAFAATGPGATISKEDREGLDAVLTVLGRESGIDFHRYRSELVRDRVLRRMRAVEAGSWRGYRERLAEDPGEIRALGRDLLHGGPDFFDDREVFAVLEREVVPATVENARGGRLRLWVPGCASGEEAYGLAMLLEEYRERNPSVSFEYRVFATDVDDAAIQRASAGRYPAGVRSRVSPARLERFFELAEDGYRLVRSLRDRVVFATHDALDEVPFTRIDLVCCRGLLGDLRPRHHGRLLRRLHASLRIDGHLVVGRGETVGEIAHDLMPVHEAWGIHRKTGATRTPVLAGRRRTWPADLPGRGEIELVNRLLLEEVAQAVVLVDGGGEILHALGETGRFLRVPAGQPSRHLLRHLAEEARAEVGTALHQAAQAGGVVMREHVPFTHPDGGFTADVAVKGAASEDDPRFVVLFGVRRTRAVSGTPPDAELQDARKELQAALDAMHAVAEDRDVIREELHSALQELDAVHAEHEHKVGELAELRSDVGNLLRGSEVGIVFLDEQLRVRKFTDSVRDTVVLQSGDVGRSLEQVHHELKGVDLVRLCREVHKTGRRVEREVRTLQGGFRLLRIARYEDGGRNEGFVVTLFDIGKFKRAERSLARSELRFQQMLENLDQVLWLFRPDGRQVHYVSPKYREVWGQAQADLYEDPAGWLEAIDPRYRESVEERFYAELARGGFDMDFEIRDRDGRPRWVRTRSFPLRDEQGEVFQVAVIGLDITVQKQQEEQLLAMAKDLEDKAQTDALTGLANRRGIEAALERELGRQQRAGHSLCAVLVDVDDFKAINTRLGHAAGDVALHTMARRMEDALRPSDVVARIGGDEFLVLLPETRLSEAVHVAERLRLAIGDGTMRSGNERIPISASMGVARVTDDVLSISEILKATQRALAEGKVRGKNRVVVATDAEGIVASVHGDDADAVSARLREEGGVRAVVQAIHDLRSGEVTGHEMLCRGPDGPYRSPADFFRLSMEKDILTIVDLRCLKACLESARRLDARGPVHLNLFPSTILDTPPERLCSFFRTDDNGMSFVLEISEQQFLGDPKYLLPPVRRLRAAGVGIALDDVGFGRSSLESLVLLEPDIVKVARTVVRCIDADVGRRRTLGRMLRAAESLDARVVAEGVETEAERAALADLGVVHAQGFLWDRPVPVEEAP